MTSGVKAPEFNITSGVNITSMLTSFFLLSGNSRAMLQCFNLFKSHYGIKMLRKKMLRKFNLYSDICALEDLQLNVESELRPAFGVADRRGWIEPRPTQDLNKGKRSPPDLSRYRTLALLSIS